METQTKILRLWLFYVLAAMAAYCFMFDSVVYAAEASVRIDFGDGHGFDMRYLYDPANPDAPITSVERFGATGAMGTTGNSEFVEFLSVYGTYASGFYGSQIVGYWAQDSVSIFRTTNPQTVRWTGPLGVLTTQFDWPDLQAEPPQEAIVHLEVINPAYRVSTYSITGGQDYTIHPQSRHTRDVVVQVPLGTTLNFSSSSPFTPAFTYEPMVVTASDHEFTRSYTLFPDVTVKTYRIQFLFLNYWGGTIPVTIGADGAAGGGSPAVYGTFDCAASPAIDEASVTKVDIVVDLPSDWPGFTFSVPDGHNITKVLSFALEGLVPDQLNVITRLIDKPGTVLEPSVGSSAGGSTVTQPKAGSGGVAGGANSTNLPFSPQNTDTSNPGVAIGGAGSGVKSVPNSMGPNANNGNPADSSALQSIAKTTKETLDKMEEAAGRNPLSTELDRQASVAAAAEAAAVPVGTVGSYVSGASDGSIFLVRDPFSGKTYNLDPYAPGRCGGVAAWFRAATAWLAVGMFAFYCVKQTQGLLIGVNVTRQADGKAVFGGTGAQATALIAAGIITATTAVFLSALFAWSTYDYGAGTVAGWFVANPYAGLVGGAVYLLDGLIPVAAILGYFVARLVWNLFAMVAFQTAAAVIRFVVL